MHVNIYLFLLNLIVSLKWEGLQLNYLIFYTFSLDKAFGSKGKSQLNNIVKALQVIKSKA